MLERGRISLQEVRVKFSLKYIRSTVCIQTLSFEIIYKVVKYIYYHLALHDVISRISLISSLSVKTLLCINHQMTNKFLRK